MIRHEFREEESDLGRILRPVADVEEVPMLMGRMDIFGRFRIIFDERGGWVDFEE